MGTPELDERGSLVEVKATTHTNEVGLVINTETILEIVKLFERDTGLRGSLDAAAEVYAPPHDHTRLASQLRSHHTTPAPTPTAAGPVPTAPAFLSPKTAPPGRRFTDCMAYPCDLLSK